MQFSKKISKVVFDFSTLQRFLHLTILISSQQMWWCSCQISDIWQKFEKWSFIHFLVLQILSSKDRQLENARLRGQLQDTQSSGKNSVKRNRGVDALTKCRDYSSTALCSKNFQNVKLRLDFVETWSYYYHSDLMWNPILVNSKGPELLFLPRGFEFWY